MFNKFKRGIKSSGRVCPCGSNNSTFPLFGVRERILKHGQWHNWEGNRFRQEYSDNFFMSIKMHDFIYFILSSTFDDTGNNSFVGFVKVHSIYIEIPKKDPIQIRNSVIFFNYCQNMKSIEKKIFNLNANFIM